MSFKTPATTIILPPKLDKKYEVPQTSPAFLREMPEPDFIIVARAKGGSVPSQLFHLWYSDREARKRDKWGKKVSTQMKTEYSDDPDQIRQTCGADGRVH